MIFIYELLYYIIYFKNYIITFKNVKTFAQQKLKGKTEVPGNQPIPWPDDLARLSSGANSGISWTYPTYKPVMSRLCLPASIPTFSL